MRIEEDCVRFLRRFSQRTMALGLVRPGDSRIARHQHWF